MKEFKPDEFLWVQKYRPQTISDLIVPNRIEKTFKSILAKNELPNLLLTSPPGQGKTTTAKAIANDMDLDVLFINASEERGIDVIRNIIKSFAGTVSLLGDNKPKLVILDESDNLTQDSQLALRAFSEEFSKNCRFILTANYPQKIIPALHSRFQTIDFSLRPNEKPEIASKLLKRLEFILNEEKVTYTKDVLAKLIMKHFPDMRKIIGECQKYSTDGKLEAEAINDEETSVDTLVELVVNGNFKEMRNWVENNVTSGNVQSLYDQFYDKIYDSNLPKESIPEVVILIGKYQYQNQVVINPKINFAAFCTEVILI
jgi:DNA polymerase III delta prime subunit